jgi:hypothetical protein
MNNFKQLKLIFKGDRGGNGEWGEGRVRRMEVKSSGGGWR